MNQNTGFIVGFLAGVVLSQLVVKKLLYAPPTATTPLPTPETFLHAAMPHVSGYYSARYKGIKNRAVKPTN
ncbi:MAG TPA: hypothetical protein PKD70_06285 [Saprospiraceae bacterium]|nr:hypothetical protein [Saprospiraceae bacterium]HMP13466.1 hypothetical protein [Saprospiraceae bacterium]